MLLSKVKSYPTFYVDKYRPKIVFIDSGAFKTESDNVRKSIFLKLLKTEPDNVNIKTMSEAFKN